MAGLLDSFKHLFSQNTGSIDYYNAMNTDIVGLNGKNDTVWMSTGYWKTADNYNDACRALASLLAQDGQFNNGDTILDVGCGAGEQDFFWKQQFPNIKIVAMDITPLHIELANARVRDNRTDINFLVGNACRIECADETFTKVIAMDCAYHFNTRQIFFEEAYRVLKPGGILIVSDMLPSENETFGSRNQIKNRQSLYIPEANMYAIKRYTQLLQEQGFTNIHVNNLSKYVFGGMLRYYLERYLHPQKPVNELFFNFNRNIWGAISKKVFHYIYGTSDYVIVIAQKPTDYSH